MKKIKQLLVVLVLNITLMLSNVLPVYASETSSTIILTDELVIQMAERFSMSINPERNLEAADPIKFYDELGQAIGYVVDYYENEIYSGYVVFDSTQEGVISEYSFDSNSKNPYQAIIDSNDNIK